MAKDSELDMMEKVKDTEGKKKGKGRLSSIRNPRNKVVTAVNPNWNPTRSGGPSPHTSHKQLQH
jgi:hypothetical protein